MFLFIGRFCHYSMLVWKEASTCTWPWSMEEDLEENVHMFVPQGYISIVQANLAQSGRELRDDDATWDWRGPCHEKLVWITFGCLPSWISNPKYCTADDAYARRAAPCSTWWHLSWYTITGVVFGKALVIVSWHWNMQSSMVFFQINF